MVSGMLGAGADLRSGLQVFGSCSVAGLLEGSLGIFEEGEEGNGSTLVFLSIAGSGKVEGEGEAVGFNPEGLGI